MYISRYFYHQILKMKKNQIKLNSSVHTLQVYILYSKKKKNSFSFFLSEKYNAKIFSYFPLYCNVFVICNQGKFSLLID